ncbi:hypothetical protein ACSBR2_035799 [Camellia fascicularis]
MSLMLRATSYVQRTRWCSATSSLASRSSMPFACSSLLTSVCVPSEEVRLSFSSNARVCFKPPLPIGYYGNAVACPTALSTAGELSLEHALELGRKTKSLVTEEYMRSTIDLVVIKGRPFIKYEQAYFVSDVHKMKFSDVDFGWGNAVFGGPSLVGEMKGRYFVYFKNEMGEDGIVVPICLPPVDMERFILEVESIFKGDDSNNN